MDEDTTMAVVLYSDKDNSIHPVIPDNTLKIIVGITCFLSIAGSLLIIFSYILFKHLRTTTRLILVHISVMDFGVAVANLAGILANFNSYYFDPVNGTYTKDGWPVLKDPGEIVNTLCDTQAALAVFFTLGSILWTLSMSVYFYFRIVHHNTPHVARNVLWIVTFLCYFIPSLFVVWVFVTNRLGYSPYASEGWCFERIVDTITGKTQIVLEIIGYDLWICLTYFLVPILYFSVILYVRQELKRSAMFVSSERFWRAVHNLDYKLLLIPFAFLLLRIWSFIEAIVYIYMGKHLPDTVHQWMVYLSGIGDSGQGFVNAIIFVLLAKKIRGAWLSFVCCKGVSFNDETSQLTFGGGGMVQEQERFCPRENTPHFYTSSYSSTSNSEPNSAHSDSYRSSALFTA